MYNGDQVKVVCGLHLTHRTFVCHLWHCIDGSTPPLRLDFEQTYGYRISAQIVRKRLQATNLWARRPVVQTPFPCPRHRRCLVFARENTQLGHQRLHNVLWNDESKFNLDYNDGSRRVWRQRNERFPDYCVVERWVSA